MSHDPLCPWHALTGDMACETCDLIARVRADQLARDIQTADGALIVCSNGSEDFECNWNRGVRVAIGYLRGEDR